MINLNKNLFDAVKKIIDEADPIGLLSSNCPSDEYSDEINLIVSYIKNNKVTYNDIKLVFHAQFDVELTDKLSHEIANKINNILNN